MQRIAPRARFPGEGDQSTGPVLVGGAICENRREVSAPQSILRAPNGASGLLGVIGYPRREIFSSHLG